MGSIEKEISQTIIGLLLKSPFYAHVLAGINREENEVLVKTIAIGMRGSSLTLFVNPAYWREGLQKEMHRMGALQHEVLHLVFQHPLQRGRFRQPFLFHIATDLIVNQYIAPACLPVGAIHPEIFPDLPLQANQPLSYYYEKLEMAQNAPQQYPISHAVLAQLALHGSPVLERHELWPESNNLIPWETQINEHLRRAQPHAGPDSLPAAVYRQLTALQPLTSPQIPWRRIIRLARESSRMTEVKDTLKRPSRRFGTLPGIRIQHRQRIFVAVDTSASIKEEELKLFFTEIHHLWRTGAEVVVVECDTAIGRVYPYRGTTPSVVSGGGGTDFVHPLQLAKQEGADLLLYFTDGMGIPPPSNLLPGKLVWIFTGSMEKMEMEAFPGRKVQLTS